MFHEATSHNNSTSQDRETRRQLILAALRQQAETTLERLADELVDLPDHKIFGPIETTLRDLGHEFVSRAHQVGIDADKKRGPSAPVASAPTARPTPD
jgi:hypothetical protein